MNIRQFLTRLSPFYQPRVQELTITALLKPYSVWFSISGIGFLGGAFFMLYGGPYILVGLLWLLFWMFGDVVGYVVWHANNKANAASKPWWDISCDVLGSIRRLHNTSWTTYAIETEPNPSSKIGEWIKTVMSKNNLQAIGITEPADGFVLNEKVWTDSRVEDTPKFKINTKLTPDEVKKLNIKNGGGDYYNVEIRAGTNNIPLSFGHQVPLLNGTIVTNKAMLMLDDRPDELPLVEDIAVFYHGDLVSVPQGNHLDAMLTAIDNPNPGEYRMILRQKNSIHQTKTAIEGVGAFVGERLDILAALIPEERTQLIAARGDLAGSHSTILAQAEIMMHMRRKGVISTVAFLKESEEMMRHIPTPSKRGLAFKIMAAMFVITIIVIGLWYFRVI